MTDQCGKESFNGILLHSAEYRSADDWAGKKCIIVGTANTAHDVAHDCVKAGAASVTMVQRSETYVLPAEWFADVQKRAYNAAIPTNTADKLGMTMPHAVARLNLMTLMHDRARKEPERFIELQRAGFRTNPMGDPMWYILERMGGHYMDIGASAEIARGSVSVWDCAMKCCWLIHVRSR